MALKIAWGRWEGQQPSPETWAVTPSGRETKLTNANVLREAVQTAVSKTRKRMAVCGGWQLPGNSMVPSFSPPYTKAEIPSASWRVFPGQRWSMVFPRRSFNQKHEYPLPSLRKLLVYFKGCNYGIEGLRLTLGDDLSCQRMGLDAREINMKREGAWDFSPLSAETGAASEQVFPL